MNRGLLDTKCSYLYI
uniref:Uncharacterized protein n=1 Tax=Anguilla anguilla TaxID=7936 RepID=A0A0E9WC07_ANGAN